MLQHHISILDAKTIGSAEQLLQFDLLGTLTVFQTTTNVERFDHIGKADIIITNKVLLDAEILQQCPSVKLICITATGTNNIDLTYAKKNGIEVMNVAGYSTESVAQFTFMSLFHLMGQMHYYDEYVKMGVYTKSDVFTHFGPGFFELKGKRWGIIGLGAIGSRVAKIASSFLCDVVYYSTSGKNDNTDYKRVSLEELLSSSTIISIHAPLNDSTKNLIDEIQLRQMRTESILINVGRGGIVNEKALAHALDENQIGGACIDVLTTEPIDSDNPLLHITNKNKLFISPHIAWTSKEARLTLIERTLENVTRFIAETDKGLQR